MGNRFATIDAEQQSNTAPPSGGPDIDTEIKQWSQPAGAASAPPKNRFAGVDDEQAAEAAAARAAMAGHRQRAPGQEREKPEIEFKDAPTIFDLPLPGVKGMPGLRTGDQGVSFGDKMALQFGPLFTDSPVGRADIVKKHLPGSEAKTDKFGNPYILYNGKPYYTSRPGEFDKMDFGRAVMMAPAAAAAAATTPVSVPGSIIMGGLLNIGQSLGEDALASAAGDTTQDVTTSLYKAGVAGLLGVAPAAAPVLRAVGSPVYNKVATRFFPMFHGSGTPTGYGARVLKGAGFTDEQIAAFTPEIRQKIEEAANKNFGSSKSAATGYREGLGEEFLGPGGQTKGEISGDPNQITTEKNLRGGSYGPGPQATVVGQVTARDEALNKAQQTLRAEAGAGGVPLTSGEAGEQLTAAQQALQKDYQKNTVAPAYKLAADEKAVVAAGGDRRVDLGHFQAPAGGGNSPLVTDALAALPEGITSKNIPDIAPNATKMVDQLKTWSRPGLDGTLPVTATKMSWEAWDKMRQQLRVYYDRAVEAAAATGGKSQDVSAAKAVWDAFNKRFEGGNPLLKDATAKAEAGFRFFRPQEQQTDLTQNLLTRFNKPATALPGTEVMDTVFGAGLKTGKALDTVEHLVSLHPPGTPGHQALAQESIRRLVADPDNAKLALSPKRIADNIDDALGDRQGAVYRTILSDEQIQRLQRFRDLNRNLAEAGSLNNPSGSGHLGVAAGRSGAAQAAGATIGGMIGDILGKTGRLVGAVSGRAAAKATMGYLDQRVAEKAVAPVAGAVYHKSYGPIAAGAQATVPAAREGLTDDQGLLGPQSPMQNLWRGILGNP